MRAYARRRGCRLYAVQRAVATGRIHLVDGKIDPESADREWAANTRPAANAGHQGGEGGQHGGEQGSAYRQARADRERYLARIARLNYQETVAGLVDVGQVRATAERLVERARQVLLALPGRLALAIAAQSDVFEVRRMLLEELRAVCEQLARGRF